MLAVRKCHVVASVGAFAPTPVPLCLDASA